MAVIKVMDELLANKIAAGEVVERCASVVKELVENSIDAGSTEIKVELEDAGTRQIKVIDNGKGMDKEDAILAFSRHATSKIDDEDDLYRLTTLGFRGEALASIAAVSKVDLKTCMKDIGTHVVINGGKISKSLGNYKDPRDYIKEYGVDAVRYFALREVPFGNDGNFSEDLLINRTNSDLANILGNLVNRTIGMSIKYFNGIVSNKEEKEDIDNDLINYAVKLKNKVDTNMDNLEISVALDNIFELFRKCNKYIDDTMPWVLYKDPNNYDRLSTILYNLIESIRIGAVLLQPFLPSTANKIFFQINTKQVAFDTLTKFGLYENNNHLNNPEVLFQRINMK